MSDKTRYIYEVHPRKAINIPEVGTIRVNKSVPLTIDDVSAIFDEAHIWRRFTNPIQSVRVTRDSIERLHNERFIDEDEWQKIRYTKAPETTPVATTPMMPRAEEEKDVVEDKVEIVEDVTTADVIEEDDVTNENIDNTVINDQLLENNTVEDETTVGEDTNIESIEDTNIGEDNTDEINATVDGNHQEGSEQFDESVESNAVIQDQEEDTEDSTDDKEDELGSETSIRDQDDTNQYNRKKNYGNKKHRR